MQKLGAYVIAIDSIPDRAKNAARVIPDLQTYELFDEVSAHPAVYWKTKGAIVDYLTRHPRYTFKEGYLEEALVGQVAVTLSHIGVWRRLLDSDHDGAVVFEDDLFVIDRPGFREIVEHLKADGTEEWVRLHLHRKFRTKILEAGAGQLLIDDPQPWGFAAYYVSREGARKLLENCRDIEAPIDLLPPALKERKVLDTKTMTKFVLGHEAFTGDEAELRGRADLDVDPHNLQKIPSTIYNSPKVSDDAELRRFMSRLNQLAALRRDGFTILRGVYDRETIQAARKRVLEHRALFKNTRPTASAGHLAGFHRFPALEPLHALLTGNARIGELIDLAVGGEGVCTIGLSDITINRSQQWHVDLLRGKFKGLLSPPAVWGPEGGGLYKVLLYLNDSDSLKVIKGSHRKPIPLDSDVQAEPDEEAEVTPVGVRSGDVVVMDLRCRHRGAEESAYASGQWDDEPRMLVSTVLGGAERKLTKAMEVGNFFRLMEWWDRLPPSMSIRARESAAPIQRTAGMPVMTLRPAQGPRRAG